MKFDLKTWIILALLAGIALLFAFWPSPKPDTSEPYQREIARLGEHIETLNQDRAKLQAEIDTIKLREVKIKVVYEGKVKKMSSVIADLRANPKVVKVLEENPTVDSLVQAQDSTIMLNQVRISGLEHSLFQMQLNTEALQANFDQAMELERAKYDAAQKEIERLQKENRKERRKGKLKAILIPVAGAVAFVLGSQL